MIPWLGACRTNFWGSEMKKGNCYSPFLNEKRSFKGGGAEVSLSPGLLRVRKLTESLLSSAQALFSAALCGVRRLSVVLMALTSSISIADWMGGSVSLSFSCTSLLTCTLKKIKSGSVFF